MKKIMVLFLIIISTFSTVSCTPQINNEDQNVLGQEEEYKEVAGNKTFSQYIDSGRTIWYEVSRHGGNEYEITKDTQIDRVYVIQEKKVTMYDLEKISNPYYEWAFFNDELGDHDYVKLGELKGKSDDEVITYCENFVEKENNPEALYEIACEWYEERGDEFERDKPKLKFQGDLNMIFQESDGSGNVVEKMGASFDIEDTNYTTIRLCADRDWNVNIYDKFYCCWEEDEDPDDHDPTYITCVESIEDRIVPDALGANGVVVDPDEKTEKNIIVVE